MARQLDTDMLDNAAAFLANEFMKPGVMGNNGKRHILGRAYVMETLYHATFKDAHEYLVPQVMEHLAGKSSRALAHFERLAKETFTPRDDKVFAALLKEKLAIDIDGNHIEGAIGTTQVGVRPIRRREYEVETRASILARKAAGLPLHVEGRKDRETETKLMLETWPVYIGEAIERDAGRVTPIGRPGADELPEDAFATLSDGRRPAGAGAVVTNISAESCIAALDAIVDLLDEGDAAANIRWRTGSMPDDPDDTETGTLLGTNVMSDPAFNGAADDSDGTCSATADTVSDDSSADASGTVTYARMAATGTGADDHIDGNVDVTGNSPAIVVNTTSFVAGSTISVTSAVVNMSQGGTAS